MLKTDLRGSPPPPSTSFPASLQLVIPHLEPSLTRSILRYAANLAPELDVRLRLIDIHVVPYGVPLDKPAVDPRHLENRLQNLAEESSLPVAAEIVYARDWEHGLRHVLAPGSLVLMGIRRAWWRSSEKRRAARLRKAG